MKLKNKNMYSFIILTLIVCVSIALICNKNSNNTTLDEVRLKDINKENSTFAIMIEDNDNSDTYTEYKEGNSVWPGIGYIFNKEKSGCMDSDGKKVYDVQISFNDETHRATVNTNKTVYCYLYFKKDSEVPTVEEITITGTSAESFELTDGYTHTKEVKVNASWSDEDVINYCLTEDSDSNSCEWQSIDAITKKIIDQSYTIKDETEGLKTIKLYTKDIAGNISENPGSGAITLDTVNPTASIILNSKTNTTISTNIEGTDLGYEGSGIKNTYAGTSEDNLNLITSTYNLNGLVSGNTYTIYAYVIDNSGRQSNLTNSESIRTYYCSEGTYQTNSSYGGICTIGPESKTDTKSSENADYLGVYTGRCTNQSNCTVEASNYFSPYATGIWCNLNYCDVLRGCSARCNGYRKVTVTTYYCKDGWETLSGSEANTICYKKADD